MPFRYSIVSVHSLFVARKPSTLELEEKSVSPPVPSPSLDRTFLSALRFEHR